MSVVPHVEIYSIMFVERQKLGDSAIVWKPDSEAQNHAQYDFRGRHDWCVHHDNNFD